MRGGPPVSNYELNRWARRMASEHNLKPREAHVLLVLSTYANEQRLAWPSIRSIALACGLRPVRDPRPTAGGNYSYSNSSVSAAIRRLEDLGLLWTRQGGHGKPAERELLFTPEPSATKDGNARRQSTPETFQPSATPDAEPSATPDEKNQRKNSLQTTKTEEPQSHPASRMATHPPERMAESDTVRALIDNSLRSVA